MVGEEGEPIDPAQQALILYLYVDDVPAKHAELTAAGIEVRDIEHPFWSPRGEFRLKDPDGWDLIISHT